MELSSSTSGVARVLTALVQRYVMGPLVTLKQLRNSFVLLSIYALVTKRKNAIANWSIRNCSSYYSYYLLN